VKLRVANKKLRKKFTVGIWAPIVICNLIFGIPSIKAQENLVKVSHTKNNLDKVALREVFKNHFLIGAALNEAQYSEQDNIRASIVKEQFSSISPENDLKWERIHPELDKYNFGPADKYVEFGVKNNMFIVGHTLVWHAQTPKWVFENLVKVSNAQNNLDKVEPVDKETLLQRMRDHIIAVVGRYKGKVKGWDVVNEALDEDGSLRKSPWMNIIGEEYILKAFQYAHEADPDAELYYNDFSIENPAKRAGAIALIKKLQSQGAKISGIGIQGHYLMDWPTPGLLDSAITDFTSLGVKVMLTELDVDILPRPDSYVGAEVSRTVEYQAKYNPFTKGLPDEMQKKLAQRYEELFKVFVKHGVDGEMTSLQKMSSLKGYLSRVTFWGVTDKESWLNYWPIRGRTSYPLLFDREGKPKQAFNAAVKTAAPYLPDR